MKFFVCTLLMLIFGTQTFALTAQAATPKVDAQGAVLIDAKTGRVLWGKNESNPLAMASTTKIMTAILAIQSGKADEIVTVSRRAAAAPKVKMGLSPGEKIRLGDLMLALMLESSNDAAVAIAEHLSGSVDAFCAEMTQKARELGAVDTIFETASGLDAGDHHSTPHDLAIITQYALEVPGFIELTNMRHASFKSDRRGYTFNNRNRLLNEFSGANGVKTGFTNKAGHCFVGAAKRDDMQLISVVLASGWGEKGRNQKWIDTKAVLNYGFDNFKYETIITPDDTAGTLPITRSKTTEINLAFEDGVIIPLTQAELESITVDLHYPDEFKAPVQIGETMGSARIYIGDKFYSEVSLVTTAEALRHDLKTSIEKVLNAYFQQITEVEVDIVLPEF